MGKHTTKERKAAIASTITLMLLWGSARPLLAKIIMQMSFDKPVFISMATFLGMAGALILNKCVPWMQEYEAGISKHKGETQVQRLKAAGNANSTAEEVGALTRTLTSLPAWLKPALPSFFDMIASVIYFMVLTLMPASVLEILRNGLELIFSAIMSIFFRSRKVGAAQWAGIFLTIVGMSIVGYADILKTQANAKAAAVSDQSHMSHSYMLVGMGGLFIQCVLGALQDTSEEVIMQEWEDASGSFLLGMEGCYEFMLALILVVPLSVFMHAANGGPLEDWSDSFERLGTSSELVWVIVLYMIMVLLGNLWNIFVIELTSATARNLWKSFRSVIVWGFELILYYFVSHDLGDGWYESSWLKLVGLALCIGGVKCFHSEHTEAKAEQEEELEKLITPSGSPAKGYGTSTSFA